jgi:hypothetical protein
MLQLLDCWLCYRRTRFNKETTYFSRYRKKLIMPCGFALNFTTTHFQNYLRSCRIRLNENGLLLLRIPAKTAKVYFIVHNKLDFYISNKCLFYIQKQIVQYKVVRTV